VRPPGLASVAHTAVAPPDNVYILTA
jgi:hypothetical protein